MPTWRSPMWPPLVRDRVAAAECRCLWKPLVRSACVRFRMSAVPGRVLDGLCSRVSGSAAPQTVRCALRYQLDSAIAENASQLGGTPVRNEFGLPSRLDFGSAG